MGTHPSKLVAGLLCLCASSIFAQEPQPTPDVTPVAPKGEVAPASEADVRVRDLLLQADRVKLEVESVGIDDSGFGVSVIKTVATVAPGDFRAALDKLRLQPYKDSGFGTTTNPILYFVFFRADRELGFLTLGYNYEASEFWISAPDSKRHRERANLNAESVLLLRLWVSDHPQLQKILLRLGASPSDLKPDLRQPK